MRVDILTLFPSMFPGVLGQSILARASAAGLVSYHTHDVRAYTDSKHGKVDDRPFGGGPGMVMMCQPLHDCVHAVEAMDERPVTRVLLTPQGRLLRQELLEDLATRPRLLLIAGHYEGIDERIIEQLDPLEVSIGDYVLSGGELPAMVLVDAVVRLIPGVLGHEESASQDSFSSDARGRRVLDCPHYTRPRVYEGRAVPEVLLSGDHQAIDAWRQQQRLERTRRRRPDLLGEDEETVG